MNREKEPIDRKKLLGTIVGIILFLGCALFFTYAWYEWRSEETNVDLVIQDKLPMTCTPGPNVNVLNIGPVLNIVDGVKANFTVENNSQDSSVFALYLDITSISENLLVSSFKYVLVVDTAGGENYDYQNPILEGNFTSLSLGTNELSVAVPVNGNSVSTYQFIVYIDGNMPNGESMMEGSMTASLSFGDCSSGSASEELLNDYIMNLYQDGSALTTIHIGGDESKPTVSQNATQGIMLDNNGEYRYYGANPNNYVEFNGELWRIISVSNVKSNATDTTGSMRVKIIRNESIGDYSWDSSDTTVNGGNGVNNWASADANTLLNNLYYNSQSGTCYNEFNNTSGACDFTTIGLNVDAKNMIDDALWYLGGIDSTSNFYANDYYSIERGTQVYDCASNGIDEAASCPRPTTWSGKVGLVYSSDYAYANDFENCNKDVDNYVSCANSPWLNLRILSENQNGAWTISSELGNPVNVFSIVVYLRNGDEILGYGPVSGGAYMGRSLYPTVYLKDTVKVIDGEGTSENPYKLQAGS